MTYRNIVRQLNHVSHKYHISLFLVLSVVLHALLLIRWENPIQFDFGAQLANQQTIQISLSTPTPKQPDSELTEKQEEPVPEPAKEPLLEEAFPVETEVEPTPQPEPKVIEKAEPPAPALAPEPKPKPKPEPEPEPEPEPSQPEASPLPLKPQEPPLPFQQKETHKPATTVQPTEAVPPKKVEVPTTEPQPKPKPKPKPKTVSEPKVASSKNEATQQSKAMIRRLIQSELVRHFQYPRLAQRRGWEGKIHLEFTVQPSGNISNIRILEGSRHGILNRSAVDTMTRIDTLNQISEGMLLGPIRMEIPIIYQLSDR